MMYRRKRRQHMDENHLTFTVICCILFRNKTNLESGASTAGKSPRKQNTTCVVIKFAGGSLSHEGLTHVHMRQKVEQCRTMVSF